MRRYIFIYTTLIGLLFSISGCDWLIYDFYEDDYPSNKDSTPIVYLSIQRAAHTNGEESINEDGVDYEDRVHDLATLVFDSNTEELVSSYFNKNIPFSKKNTKFTLELTIGERDFYFVANTDMSELEAITTASQMEIYMKNLRNLDEDLYLNAKENKGFPMARVYKNQEILQGGSFYLPQPFHPVVDGVPETKVKLIRTVAKLEIKLDGDDAQNLVESITYRNAYRQFSLSSLSALSSPDYYDDKPLKKAGNVYTYYMPEAIMTSPNWESSGNNKPINYFVIKTFIGDEYEIPIISHSGSINASDYMDFAKGNSGNNPDYSIYRNRHYVYDIQKLETFVELIYKVEDWDEVKIYTYMGYGYNVIVDDEGNVTVSNTIDACDPHKIKLQTQGSFEFSDGDTEKVFSSLIVSASQGYEINPEPKTGDGVYLKVLYNDVEVKTFSK